MKVFAAAAVVAGVAAMASPAFAASDTWNQTGGTHNWRDGANWLSGVQYPDGAGDVAGFTNDITAAQLVTNGTAVTVGTIHLGDSAATLFGFTVGAFANTINLDNGGSASVVNNLAGVNVIQAKLVATGANQDLTVNLAAGSLNIGSTGTQSPMTIDTLRINLASGVTLGLGTAGSTLTDPNVYLDGAGTVNILGNHALPTNSVVTLSNGATLAGGGGRVQDLAEIRGNGVFRSGGNARLVVGSPTANYDSVTFGGTTITNGGRLRPGDITGTGEIGTLFIGTPPVPNATHLTVGGEYFFDIASHSLFDQIDIRRTITTVTGGDVYINFVGSFQPTNGAQFRLFVNTSTRGYVDGNGGDVFDNIRNANTLSTNFFYVDDYFRAVIGDAVLATENPGGLDGRNIIFTYYIPEPGVLAFGLLAGAGWLLRRRRA